MIRLTRRGEVVAGLAVTAGLISAMWLATIAGNLATGSPEVPTSPTSAVLEGEAGPAATPEAVQPLPPRATPLRAARTRPSAAAARHHGRHLSVTCYVATGNRTASGVWPAVGQAASNLYPFGTKLHVEGVGFVTVTDRIGHSSDLDLFYSSRSACVQFGRQRLLVEVIR